MSHSQASQPRFDPLEFRSLCLAVAGGAENPIGVVGEIFRDINRTFPWHPMFAEGQGGMHCGLFNCL